MRAVALAVLLVAPTALADPVAEPLLGAVDAAGTGATASGSGHAADALTALGAASGALVAADPGGSEGDVVGATWDGAVGTKEAVWDGAVSVKEAAWDGAVAMEHATWDAAVAVKSSAWDGAVGVKSAAWNATAGAIGDVWDATAVASGEAWDAGVGAKADAWDDTVLVSGGAWNVAAAGTAGGAGASQAAWAATALAGPAHPILWPYVRQYATLLPVPIELVDASATPPDPADAAREVWSPKSCSTARYAYALFGTSGDHAELCGTFGVQQAVNFAGGIVLVTLAQSGGALSLEVKPGSSSLAGVALYVGSTAIAYKFKDASSPGSLDYHPSSLTATLRGVSSSSILGATSAPKLSLEVATSSAPAASRLDVFLVPFAGNGGRYYLLQMGTLGRVTPTDQVSGTVPPRFRIDVEFAGSTTAGTLKALYDIVGGGAGTATPVKLLSPDGAAPFILNALPDGAEVELSYSNWMGELHVRATSMKFPTPVVLALFPGESGTMILRNVPTLHGFDLRATSAGFTLAARPEAAGATVELRTTPNDRGYVRLSKVPAVNVALAVTAGDGSIAYEERNTYAAPENVVGATLEVSEAFGIAYARVTDARAFDVTPAEDVNELKLSLTLDPGSLLELRYPGKMNVRATNLIAVTVAPKSIDLKFADSIGTLKMEIGVDGLEMDASGQRLSHVKLKGGDGDSAAYFGIEGFSGKVGGNLRVDLDGFSTPCGPASADAHIWQEGGGVAYHVESSLDIRNWWCPDWGTGVEELNAVSGPAEYTFKPYGQKAIHYSVSMY